MNRLFHFAGNWDWLYQGLKENTHLIEIHCYANTMTLSEGKLLLEALEVNTTLQSVNLIENDQNNSIQMLAEDGGEEVMTHIKQALLKNQPEYQENILNSLLTISGSGMQPLVQNIILPYLGIMFKNKEKLKHVLQPKIENIPNVLTAPVQNVLLAIQQLEQARREENKENMEQAMQSIGELSNNFPSDFQNDNVKEKIQNALNAVDRNFNNDVMLKRKTNLLRLQFGIEPEMNTPLMKGPR